MSSEATNNNETPSNSPKTPVEPPSMKRVLKLPETTFLGIGTAIGGAMFATLGTAINVAGPSIILTFILGLVFAIFVGMVYAELGASVPNSAGGSITFVRRAFGEGQATFITGWFDWIGSIVNCAMGALVFAFSLSYLINGLEPYTVAVITLICFAILNMRGTKYMGVLQLLFTFILIGSIITYIGCSAWSFQPARFQPFFPNSFLPTLFMVSYIFPTFTGYEAISQMSEEVKIAGKTVPRALFLTLFVIALLFIGTAIATIGAAPAEIYINSTTPLQNAATYFFGPIGGIVASIGAIVAAITSVNGSMAGGARIAFALGRYNMLSQHLAKVHNKYRTPHIALGLTMLVAVGFVLTRSVDLIIYAITVGYSITGIMVIISLIWLRKIEPQLFRPYRLPLYPLPAILGILMLGFLIITVSPDALLLAFFAGLLGFAIFFAKNAFHTSKNQKANGETKKE